MIVRRHEERVRLTEAAAEPIELPPGMCDLWVTSVRDARGWHAWLTDAERRAVARGGAEAELRATSRALQRVVVSAYSGVPWHVVEIDRTCSRCGDASHGRPTASHGPPYSVTRSGSRVAIALTRDGEIGIDAELDRPADRSIRTGALVGTALADAGADLAGWVRREAQIKARSGSIADLWVLSDAEISEGLHVVVASIAGRVAALATSRPVEMLRWQVAAPPRRRGARAVSAG